jgi:hypothetical protein
MGNSCCRQKGASHDESEVNERSRLMVVNKISETENFIANKEQKIVPTARLISVHSNLCDVGGEAISANFLKNNRQKNQQSSFSVNIEIPKQPTQKQEDIDDDFENTEQLVSSFKSASSYFMAALDDVIPIDYSVKSEIIEKIQEAPNLPSVGPTKLKKEIKVMGLPSMGMRLRQKIMVVNRTSFAQIVFILSSDPTATRLEEGNLSVSATGGEVGFKLQLKNVVTQVNVVNPACSTLFRVRTNENYLTVLVKRSASKFDVIRFNRGLAKGCEYTVHDFMLNQIIKTVDSSFINPYLEGSTK